MTSSITTLMSQGGSSSSAVVTPAKKKVTHTSPRYGARYDRTLRSVFTGSLETFFVDRWRDPHGNHGNTLVEWMSRKRSTVSSFKQGLNHRGGFFAPIGIKLFQLGQGRHVGHPINKQFSDEVVHFMLDAHRIESVRFKVLQHSLSIIGLHT